MIFRIHSLACGCHYINNGLAWRCFAHRDRQIGIWTRQRPLTMRELLRLPPPGRPVA